MNSGSSTAVFASAILMAAATCSGQTQARQNPSSTMNFYVTTPQTGEKVSVGQTAAPPRAVSTAGRSSSREGAAKATLSRPNVYISTAESRPVQASRGPQVTIPQESAASTRAAYQVANSSASSSRSHSPRTAQASTSGYTIQQVSNPASSFSTSGQRSTSLLSQNSNSRVVATSAQAPNFYSQSAQAQTTANRAYVSNAGAATVSASSGTRRGFFNRIMHPGSSGATASAGQKTSAGHSSLWSHIKPSSLAGRVQEGMASWYGKDFHGDKTANGETYDMNSMTAAHKSLPFGTLVKVHNERNGRECVVRINNRGPYSHGRIIDLSKAAASTLGMIGSGVAKVRCEVIGRS